MPKFAANISMMFNELEFFDRFEAASEAGFSAVEFLFPYAWDVKQLRSKLVQHGLQQVLHNMPPGDWDSGERGIAILPDRTEEFKQSVRQTIEYATTLQCPQVNCLAGLAPKDVPPEILEQTFVSNLEYAANELKQHGIKLLIEAINSTDMPGFYLNNSQQAMSIIEQVRSDNLYFQYDIYHMQIMEGNLATTIEKLLSHIPHMQLADTPGRHEPGTGEINYPWLFQQLDKIGYDGWIGCEYKPKNGTLEGLGWFRNVSAALPTD